MDFQVVLQPNILAIAQYLNPLYPDYLDGELTPCFYAVVDLTELSVVCVDFHAALSANLSVRCLSVSVLCLMPGRAN